MRGRLRLVRTVHPNPSRRVLSVVEPFESLHRGPRTSPYLTAPDVLHRPASAPADCCFRPPAFQAGHAGSIPVIRSTENLVLTRLNAAGLNRTLGVAQHNSPYNSPYLGRQESTPPCVYRLNRWSIG